MGEEPEHEAVGGRSPDRHGALPFAGMLRSGDRPPGGPCAWRSGPANLEPLPLAGATAQDLAPLDGEAPRRNDGDQPPMPSRALLPTFLLLAALLPAQRASGSGDRDSDPSEILFGKGLIPRLEISLSGESAARLREKPREYVQATVTENGKSVFPSVSVKLKGAAGSFREFDDRPALTLRFDRDEKDQRFHGLKKLHLNNSVQDPTYIHEHLGSTVFRSAKIPAPRVTHARVWINERDLGLYVLKEGFDDDFLIRNRRDGEGNLYDGGFCQDVGASLSRNAGKGKNERLDLKALHQAAVLPDMAERWRRLEEQMDVREFLTFMAVEMMLGHWDGYSLNRNNYRLYFAPGGGKASFFPHGMDQILGNPDASILDQPGAMVASSVMKRPEWRTAFRKRLKELLPLFSAGRLESEVRRVEARLKPVLLAMDRDEARAHEDHVRGLIGRIKARERSLKEQVNLPDPRPLAFRRNSPIRIQGWRPASESADARIREEKSAGDRAYMIEAGRSGQCIASWRRNVLLERGAYRFSATVTVRGVEPLQEEEGPGTAAGLRISGSSRTNSLSGSSALRTVTFDFEIEEEARDVELVAELRASRGEAAFLVDSMRLTKLSP